jgi:hypothetical protein
MSTGAVLFLAGVGALLATIIWRVTTLRNALDGYEILNSFTELVRRTSRGIRSRRRGSMSSWRIIVHPQCSDAARSRRDRSISSSPKVPLGGQDKSSKRPPAG